MTQDEVRAAAEQLVQFHERFAPLFGKEQAQDHAYTYVKGLMFCPERKSIEPIALHVGDGKSPRCRSSSTSPPGITTTSRPRSSPSSPTSWLPTAAAECRRHRRRDRRERLRQEGGHSAGVARQHNGRLGKEDNCQVGVFLVGGDPRRRGVVGSSIVLAGVLVRGQRGVPGTPRQGPHPRASRLPDQAPDRRATGPA